MPYINYVSEAPVTLPHLNFQREVEAPPSKICYGDLYRAAAPAPKEFVPDERTLADRAHRRQRTKVWRARTTSPANRVPRKRFEWSPESVARMIELIKDYGLCRRLVAEKINAEFPQPYPVNKSGVVVKFIRETKDPNYGRARHD